MTFRNSLALASTGMICLVIAGCGGGPDDMPDVGQVTGTVTVDGKPTAGLMVTFQPEAGRPSYATTNESGVYELQYNSDTTGAKVGTNLVTISTDSTDDGEDYEADTDTSAEQDAIPARYNTMAGENPEMTVDVKPGSNTFDFILSSK